MEIFQRTARNESILNRRGLEAGRQYQEELMRNLGSLDSRDWNRVRDRASRQSAREAEIALVQGRQTQGQGSGVSSTGRGEVSTDLFGSGAGFNLDDMTARAKDLARFRLGLDTEQARMFRGLREEESQANFGRDMQRLQSEQAARVREIQEQFGGQERLTNITQGALTGRLEKELSNRLTQQERSNAQQNLAANRAIGLASRRLGG